jgi:uncharacterized membrane protein YhhN
MDQNRDEPISVKTQFQRLTPWLISFFAVALGGHFFLALPGDFEQSAKKLCAFWL